MKAETEKMKIVIDQAEALFEKGQSLNAAALIKEEAHSYIQAFEQRAESLTVEDQARFFEVIQIVEKLQASLKDICDVSLSTPAAVAADAYKQYKPGLKKPTIERTRRNSGKY